MHAHCAVSERRTQPTLYSCLVRRSSFTSSITGPKTEEKKIPCSVVCNPSPRATSQRPCPQHVIVALWFVLCTSQVVQRFCVRRFVVWRHAVTTHVDVCANLKSICACAISSILFVIDSCLWSGACVCLPRTAIVSCMYMFPFSNFLFTNLRNICVFKKVANFFKNTLFATCIQHKLSGIS